MRRFICLTLTLLVAATLVPAQEFRASIAGIVRDSSGAIVPGAKVTATNIERGLSTEAVSNESGRYLLQFLMPGAYRVAVEKSGFRTYQRDGIRLIAADRLGLDVALEVGTLSDAITVVGEVPLLQTETASRTAVVDNKVVENVPAGTRNVFALQYTQAGVVKASTYWGTMGITAFGNIDSVAIGGGVKGENEAVMDGVTTTQSSRGVAYVPPLSTTQEVTIQSNSYDAQFGRTGGGVTMINLKSGTNSLHGQMYEFNMNKSFISMPWEANKAGLKKKDIKFNNNNFGIQMDGPVYIPKVFDGRNRLFFMISYEGERNRQTGGQVRTLPTAEQLQGDFSQLYTNAGKPVTIYDPLTTALGPDGKTFVRSPFPGNAIPKGRINPVAANLAAFYPQPTWAGDGLSRSNNYMNFMPNTGRLDAWLGKIDYQITSKSRLSFRYGQSDDIYYQKRVWGTNAAEPNTEWPGHRVPRNWGADWTYTISPNLIFNLRGGLARYETFNGNSFAQGFDPRTLGFPDSLVRQFTTLQFPRVNIDGYSEMGATYVTNYPTHDSWSMQPNLSYIMGRHFLKFGGEGRRYNDNALQPGAAAGIYSFTRLWTQANPQQADALSGNGFASFLLGYPTSGSVDRNIDPSYSNFYYALFLQDDLKLTSKLTLNLGLRWDYETPRWERYDRMVRGFAFGEASPLASKVQGLNLKGGLQFAGVNGQSRYAFDTYKKNFQPRIGVAYQFRPKWVLRGGWALSYLGQSSNGAATGFSIPTPLVATLNSITPAASLSDPFPASVYPNGLLTAPGSSAGLSANLGQAIAFQHVGRELPYSHQYSFGLQRELPGGWIVDATYVGNQTFRRPVSLNLNFLPLSVLESIPVDQRAAYFVQAIANPMAGLLPSSSLNGATLRREQLLVAYPQYTSVSVSDIPIGKQRYDSFQFTARHRFSNGLSLTASYTLSKTLEEINALNAQDADLSNVLNTRLERRLIEYDIPQKLAIVGSYDLPFGRRRRLLSNMHPVLNGFIGGWILSGQSVYQSGFPFAFPNAAPLSATSAKLTNEQRDERARSAGRDGFDPSIDKWFDTSLFGTKAGPAPYTLQNFPTRFPDVRSMAFYVVDLSLNKEFPIKETLRCQFRMDAQNIMNHPWLSKLQSNNVTNSRFGQLAQEMSNVPRMIALGIKLVF
ncbi:MAG TPA: TonB-dependent receptor [Bryobacteraceae bacterium]|nr:TonB-dependent receptor [Bryobacteraceae bacterium]